MIQTRIKYTVHKNYYDGGKTSYHAKVKTNGTVSMDGLIDEIVSMSSTTAKSDALAVYADLKHVLETKLKLGYNVELEGICTITSSITGKFDSLNDTFDPKRHAVNIRARGSKKLKRIMNTNTKLRKLTTAPDVPLLLAIDDYFTDTKDTHVTQNHICGIRGKRLKFDTQNPDEGVFVIDPETKTEIQVTQVSKNHPTEILFLMPSLTSNKVTIEIRSRLNKNLKAIRTGMFPTLLTVETM